MGENKCGKRLPSEPFVQSIVRVLALVYDPQLPPSSLPVDTREGSRLALCPSDGTERRDGTVRRYRGRYAISLRGLGRR
jgi:hypothetical protein